MTRGDARWHRATLGRPSTPVAVTAGPTLLTAPCDDLQSRRRRPRWSLNYQLRLRCSEKSKAKGLWPRADGKAAPPKARVRGPHPAGEGRAGRRSASRDCWGASPGSAPSLPLASSVTGVLNVSFWCPLGKPN